MYLDFLESKNTEFNVDICIIGAGAAGFSCALEFLGTNLNILVIEGGGLNYSKTAAELNNAEVCGMPHSGIHDARERIVGGTTTKWGGQAYPFDKQDFVARPHIEHSGWPLSFTDLEPYYRRADIILGTDSTIPFTYSPWDDRNIKKPEFAEGLQMFVTKWAEIPDFSLQHGSKIKSSINVNLLYHANVTEIIPSHNLDSVSSLRIHGLDGRIGHVRAKYFIAAGGAIETVRLFLSSTKFDENGLGNGNDLVGRFFQDHVGAIVGQVIPHSKAYFHNIFDSFYKRGFKYYPRLKIDTLKSATLGLLHSSAQIVFTTHVQDHLNQAKSVIKKIKNKKLPSAIELKALLNPLNIIHLTSAFYRWKILRRGSSPRKGFIWLEVHSEQEPLKESRISLASEVDALGMRRVRLHWKVSTLTVETIKTTAKTVASEFQKCHLGQVLLEPWIFDQNFDATPLMYDTYHQAGGLKMATDSIDGVVDESCKVFGIKNLYVASSAVFPSSSFSNPTLTIMALAIRIADTILCLCKEEKLPKNYSKKDNI